MNASEAQTDEDRALIVPADDSFHERSADPFWNESSWFSVTVAERDLQGLVYLWYRPNMNLVCAGPAFWDSTGANAYDCLYYDLHWLQPIPKGTDMLSASLPTGLSVDRVEPLQEYRLRYRGEGCSFDLVWTAVTRPHEIGASATGAAGHGHYEQAGRLTGMVTIADERISVDCYSMRDRSWGPRNFDRFPSGDYLWGIESESSSFHLLALEQGPVNEIVAGYLMRDGRMADLVSGRSWTEGRDGIRSKRIFVEAEDTLGRRIEAEGRTRNALHLTLYPRQFTSFCLVEWEIDGRRVSGEQQAFFPLERVRAMLRAAAARPRR